MKNSLIIGLFTCLMLYKNSFCCLSGAIEGCTGYNLADQVLSCTCNTCNGTLSVAHSKFSCCLPTVSVNCYHCDSSYQCRLC